jgi:hypothetical protein
VQSSHVLYDIYDTWILDTMQYARYPLDKERYKFLCPSTAHAFSIEPITSILPSSPPPPRCYLLWHRHYCRQHHYQFGQRCSTDHGSGKDSVGRGRLQFYGLFPTAPLSLSKKRWKPQTPILPSYPSVFYLSNFAKIKV